MKRKNSNVEIQTNIGLVLNLITLDEDRGMAVWVQYAVKHGYNGIGQICLRYNCGSFKLLWSK